MYGRNVFGIDHSYMILHVHGWYAMNYNFMIHQYMQCMSQQLGSEVERRGKANKSTTPRTALSFQRIEEELSWVGFEPTTLCSLGERSTN